MKVTKEVPKEPINLEQFKDYWRDLEKCCFKHPKNFDLDNVVEVLCWEQSVPDEEPGGAIVRMRNKKFATLWESQDYTGHG